MNGLPETHDSMVSAILFGRGDAPGALARAEESIRILPDNPYVVARYKSIQLMTGRDEGWRWAAKRGAELIRVAIACGDLGMARGLVHWRRTACGCKSGGLSPEGGAGHR